MKRAILQLVVVDLICAMALYAYFAWADGLARVLASEGSPPLPFYGILMAGAIASSLIVWYDVFRRRKAPQDLVKMAFIAAVLFVIPTHCVIFGFLFFSAGS